MFEVLNKIINHNKSLEGHLMFGLLVVYYIKWCMEAHLLLQLMGLYPSCKQLWIHSTRSITLKLKTRLFSMPWNRKWTNQATKQRNQITQTHNKKKNNKTEISCLQRDPQARLTIPQLLTHPFLHPQRNYRNTLAEDILRKLVTSGKITLQDIRACGSNDLSFL